MWPLEMMDRGKVQLMNDDGIDAHVPHLLSSPPGRRHQSKPWENIALHWALMVSATRCGICWYAASSDDGEGEVQPMNHDGVDAH